MNANELADGILAIEERIFLTKKEHQLFQNSATKLRQLQKERDLLFTAHSHEMVRADRLAIENELLKTKLAQADRVYDFDNPLLDVCKHGNDSACKECYLETVKK